MRFAPWLVLVCGCINLSLPDPPAPPGPGSIQGTVVYAVAGRSGVRPAVGARITLLESGQSVVAEAETGRFDLREVRLTSGRLHFVFDLDGDGVVDRQRVLQLDSLGAGRDVALGEVVLSRNATVVGRVLRGDVPQASGHGGTSIFVPGAPFAIATGDTGDFVLENLPEGPLQLAFYRQGYRPESRDLSLRGGEETRVSTASLTADPQAMGSVTVSGVVTFDDATPIANARVRFAASTSSFVATTNAAGAFSAQTTSAQLYQVGVEADGAVSLRLYNVLLLPGANELPPVLLTRGTSTPLDLDAGLLLPNDAGTGNDPIAFIDPSVLELAPGQRGTLSSARSVGVRPLTFHWRSVADGGAQLTFDTPDTQSSSTSVFAPDAAGLYPVTLRLTDALGVDSPERVGLVRVGSRPTVTVAASMGTTVESGSMVTLRATGTSTDGQVIRTFLWAQRTGPPVLTAPPPAIDTISFTAPTVTGSIPMTFEVRAVSELGFESAPASITLALQPGMLPTLVASASPSTIDSDGGAHAVTLSASVMGGAPDASYVFSWSPVSQACRLPDGGDDTRCPEAWQLSNATGPVTQFFAPLTAGARQLQFTVTAGTGLSATTSVRINDARRPSCQATLSTLSFEVLCDEPMQVGGAFDAGPSGPTATVFVDGGAVRAYFHSVAPRTPLSLELPLTDLGSNAPQSFLTTGLVPTLSHPTTWASVATVTSSTDTRPLWVRLGASQGSPPRWALVSRATDAMNRKVWVFELDGGAQQCSLCSFDPAVYENIPGAGTRPLAGVTSSIGVDGRAYVLVSQTGPAGVVEYRDGSWRELPVMISPLFVGGLGANGQQVWMLGYDAGAVERREWQPAADGGGAYGPPEVIGPMSSVRAAELVFSPRGRAFSVMVDNAQVSSQFELASSTWAPATNQVVLGSQLVNVKSTLFGESLHEALLVKHDSDGSLIVVKHDPGNPTTPFESLPLFGGGTIRSYDVARFGDGILIAFADSLGVVQLALVREGPRGLVPSSVTLEDGGVAWNSRPADFPRVVVDGVDVWLSWQEEIGAGAYGIAGTRVH